MRSIALPPGRRVEVRRDAIAAGWIVLACAALTGPSYAQNSDARVSITPRVPIQLEARSARSGLIRTDVNRVLTSATVTDSFGRPVEGLRKQDFRLLEDGVEQNLSDFFVEDGPISVGVILDVSASVRNKLGEFQRAVGEFLRLSSRDDEFFLATFRDQPELVRGFTTDPKDIESDVAVVQPRGWTALYDAMVLGIHHMKRASRNRRVLLVLSDGGDNNSRYTEREVKDLVREADVRIFSISVQSHTPALDKLAVESGGHAYRVHKLEELPEAVVRLSAEVHAEYVLGFTPPERQRDGKYHTVKVEVLQPAGEPRLQVSWRHGYYGPLD
jgi:Ca-activated chloride channel family protein